MEITAQARWKVLNTKRSGVLARGRACSEVTIPSILPPEGHNEQSDLKSPYQSLAARGVNNLASKMLLALFPTTTTFFRYKIERAIVEELGADVTQIEEAMRQLENIGMSKVETTNLRTVLHMGFKHLIVTGNGLLHMPKTGAHRMFKLTQYVVQRDPTGKVVEIIVKEVVNKETLDDAICEACQITGGSNEEHGDKGNVDLYTHVKLKDGRHEWYQEINELKVPGSEGRTKEEDSPWIVMRWSAIENEDYGRGLCEEYLGDIITLEGLNKAIIQFAAAASKIIFLLHPNAITDEDDLVDAESGDVVTGREEDITVLQMEKFADFRVAKETADEISMRLSHAFLLRSGTTRDAERVTAEEIRAQAQELEDVLGGVYTVQASELQMPIVRRITRLMKDAGEFPKFPKVQGKDVVKPVIVTGFDALGRGHELNKLRAFYQDLQENFGPEIMQWFKADQNIKKFATAHNIELEDVLKTPEEVSAENEQAQQAAIMEKAAGPVAGQAVKGTMDAFNANE
jgi:hypothetical protein